MSRLDSQGRRSTRAPLALLGLAAWRLVSGHHPLSAISSANDDGHGFFLSVEELRLS